MNKERFGYDYYERGIETGISNYTSYRWIPELTIPMAMAIIDFLGIKPDEKILDYGCAKGFLVKALRMLRREAWGADVSDYAVSHADADVKQYVWKVEETFENFTEVKYCICKDVLEHLTKDKVIEFLLTIKAEKIFTVVPLGCNEKYTAEANGRDVTHVICEDATWWQQLFEKCGWTCEYADDRVPGIKDHYADIPWAHLFMVHRRSA